MTNETINDYIARIDDALTMALVHSQHLQKHLLETEGDSDLHRKVEAYLVPNMQHWIGGRQAGNISDLRETIARRLAEKGKTK